MGSTRWDPGPRPAGGGRGLCCSTPASLRSPLPGPWRGCPRSRVCAIRMRRSPGPPPRMAGGHPGLEKAPHRGAEKEAGARFVYELGENTRRSPNAPHKLLSSRSNKLKGGAAIIKFTRQDPDHRAKPNSQLQAVNFPGETTSGPIPRPHPRRGRQQLLCRADAPSLPQEGRAHVHRLAEMHGKVRVCW